jgi:hypothetical protein
VLKLEELSYSVSSFKARMETKLGS